MDKNDINDVVGTTQGETSQINVVNSDMPVNKKRKGTIVVISIGIAVVLMLIVYLSGVLYFNTRFNVGTVINGINCTGKTADNITKAISDEIENYVLSIQGKNSLTGEIIAENINMKAELGDSVQLAMDENNSFVWVKGLFVKKIIDVPAMSVYDETLLDNVINELAFFDEKNIKDSANAYVKYNDGEYEVIEEYYGNRVNKEILKKSIVEAIGGLTEIIKLEDTDCYIKPEILSEGEEIKNAVNNIDKYLGAKVIYEFGEVTEVVDKSKVKDWITVGDDGISVYFDRVQVKDFVRYLGRTYNTFGDTRQFKTGYGDVVTVVGGDYGWRINREAEIDELVATIKEGGTTVKEPVYYQTAVNHGANDIGNTYAEVDLTGQHMFMFVDGVKVLESDVVTGKPSTNHATPQGTYALTYKERNATLIGETYETPVDFWMPFNQDIGFHDATWQAKFGGDRYLTYGSHGCVNLPFDIAKQLYGYVYKNMPVVCYYRPASLITESTTETSTAQEGSTESITKISTNN